ncbi:hypothetical protein [Lysobacter enzymogenes]|uniref:hypothetical protein n=1 Tax=Lysobacter enzymogenes TaxID=69 RepID=UPI001A956C64|nr:hypothetical protein [Lysobacter enzymogenes]QQP94963.1 hypothetical protein JHW38_17160 [Lysobacter enzymogenes]
MGDPNRDPADGPGNGPGDDPNRPRPPASPPPSPTRPAPASDPLGTALGPILSTVSPQRPPNPAGSGPGTASQVQFDGNQPLFSGGERQTQGGAFPSTAFGGYVSRPGGGDLRIFAGSSDGPTTFAFAGRQDTGAFGLGLRLTDGTNGLGAGYANNPQTQTQTGFVRLDADRLQLTAQGSFAPNGNQFTLDGRYSLEGGRSVAANGAFNDGSREWRAGLGYNGGTGGTNLSGTVIGNPQGVGGSFDFNTQLGTGVRGGAQGNYQPSGTWSVGPRFNLELGDGWSATAGANVLRDANRRISGNGELGVSRYDERSGARFNLSAGADTNGGYNARVGVTFTLDSIGSLFSGGSRHRSVAPPPSDIGLPSPRTDPPPATPRLDQRSAVEPQAQPGDGAAAPRRTASAAGGDTNALLDGLMSGDPNARAAARNHPAAQEMLGQATAEANRQQAAQQQVAQAPTQETAPAQANPSHGARSLS